MVLMGMLDPDGDIRIRSQIYKTDGTPTDPINRADRARNVEEGRLEPYVCMKISLIPHPNPTVDLPDNFKLDWTTEKRKNMKKRITTYDDVENEVESQRNVASAMMCGEYASDIIPDILAMCMLDSTNFEKTKNDIYTISQTYSHEKGTPQIDDETKRVVDWISTNAKKYNLIVHIAFMDYIDDSFTTVDAFFNSNPVPTPYIQFDISCKALAVILTLLLKARYISWDFHTGNLLTNGDSVKGIDLGRIYKLGKGQEPDIIKDRHQITNFVFANFFELNKITRFSKEHDNFEPYKHFFDLNRILPEKDSKNLDRFNDDFNRLLIDLPNKAYEFRGRTHEHKRKNVYEALMMIAFIDGITNACLYQNEHIQCKNILINAFKDKNFSSFKQFLLFFRIDYNKFLLDHTDNQAVITNVNTALDHICQYLEPMLVPCTITKRNNHQSFRLPMNVDPDSESEADDSSKASQEVKSLERTHGVFPLEQTHEVLPLERTHEVLPLEQTHEVLPLEQTHEVLPLERTHEERDRFGGAGAKHRHHTSNKKRKYKKTYKKRSYRKSKTIRNKTKRKRIMR
jgi:hypothetical protein